MAVAYVLGFISLVVGVLLAVLSRARDVLHLTPRGGFVFAATLFLFVMASHALKTASSSPKA
jgi:hypothetical protein